MKVEFLRRLKPWCLAYCKLAMPNFFFRASHYTYLNVRSKSNTDAAS